MEEKSLKKQQFDALVARSQQEIPHPEGLAHVFDDPTGDAFFDAPRDAGLVTLTALKNWREQIERAQWALAMSLQDSGVSLRTLAEHLDTPPMTTKRRIDAYRDRERR